MSKCKLVAAKYTCAFGIAELRTRDEDERPRAYIVPKGDQPITESDVHKYMNERVAKIKRLTGGVRFVKVIPKNPVSTVEFMSICMWLTFVSRVKS